MKLLWIKNKHFLKLMCVTYSEPVPIRFTDGTVRMFSVKDKIANGIFCMLIVMVRYSVNHGSVYIECRQAKRLTENGSTTRNLKTNIRRQSNETD